MYSESDIEGAIDSGAITPAAAQALREHVAARRASPAVDEESFRLLTGFNDIFVSIAAVLLLLAVGWIGAYTLGSMIGEPHPQGPMGRGTPEWLQQMRFMGASVLGGGSLIAATSWMLGEYFTRRRRMALPSIILLGAFALGVGGASAGAFQLVSPDDEVTGFAIRNAAGGLVAAIAAYFHWRRFHVPITIAALTGALVVTLVSLIIAALPEARDAWLWMMLVAGVGIFAFAMWWDMSDRARITRRSDVAFWLHLGAAPLIAHPVFNLLGVFSTEPSVGKAVLVILLYVLFGLVALAVDRRALLVSSLAYVLYALSGLFQQAGAANFNAALTGLVIGSALLLLSAFWHVARRAVVGQLPADLRERLPELDRPAVSPRPA